MNGRKRQRPLEVSFFVGDGPPMVAFQGSPNRSPIASVNHTFRVRFHEIWDTCRGGLALHKFLGRIEWSSLTKSHNLTREPHQHHNVTRKPRQKSDKSRNALRPEFGHTSRGFRLNLKTTYFLGRGVEVRNVSVSPSVLPDDGVSVLSLILLGGPGADLDPYLHPPAAAPMGKCTIGQSMLH